MKTYLSLATPVAALVATLVSAPALAAAEPSYLPSQRAAEILVDGGVWSAHAPNGRTFDLTLDRDGTGKIRGPMPFALSVKWTVKQDALCISGTMMSKCLRFQEITGGLQGWNGDKADLRLTRPAR